MRILALNSILPFGLKHTGYQPLQQVIITPTDPIDGARTSIVAKSTIDNGNIGIIDIAPITGSATYNYKYQGQERQDEFGLGWDSFKWRNYDVAIGRFFNIDPLAEKYVDWAPYVFSGNRVIDARELEGLEPYLVSPGVYEWRVNVQTGGKFDSDFVSNHLQEVSGILSQNENLTVNIVLDNTATYTIDMSGGDMGKVEYVEGEGFVFSGGKAPLGKLSDVTITSDGSVVTTAHEMAHSAKQNHVEKTGNEDNLMQERHDTQSTNTNLTEQQTEQMNNHMESYQKFLNQ